MAIKILAFIVSLILGYLGLRYNYWIVKTVGKSAWAENHFPGATFGLYQLMALAIMALGFLYLIGVFG